MVNPMKQPLITLAAAMLLSACAPTQAATLPGPLVDAQWLQAHRDGVTVVDVRTWLDGFTQPPEYDTTEEGQRYVTQVGGHIPGARLLDYTRVRVERDVRGHSIGGRVPEAGAFQALMREAGVDGDRPIVITNPGQSTAEMDGAARVYWTLKYFGEDEVAILNGGNAAWLAAGFEASTDAAATGGGDWTADEPRAELIAEYEDVAGALEDGATLVDARTAQQFLGVSKKSSVKAAGHLRGAHNLPLDLRTHNQGPAAMFLGADEYRQIFRKTGIDAKPGTITYCNTGHLASGAWFIVSEIMGVDNARLYDGSMLEWTTLGGKDVVGLSD